MIRLGLAGAIALLPVGVAQAAVVDSIDPVAYSTMANGRYSAAEQRLASRIEKGSTEPGVLLNLAHIYVRDGRGANAAAMYRQVLAAGNVQMEMADGSARWSHDLAERGLKRVNAIALR